MTTINNSENLIEKVGGIEKARAIVGGAPVNINYRFYSMNVGNGNSGWHVDFRSDCIDMVDLRIAIAKHDSRAFKLDDLIVFRHGDNTEILKVQYVWDDAVWGGYCGEIYKNNEVRHATPLEIKAGHRIDDTTEQAITKLCIGCGSPDLHKGGEIKEPKMCLDCFAEMVGFTRTSNGFVESDEVTDIRNHVSPSTLVWDLASGEDWTVEAECHG